MWEFNKHQKINKREGFLALLKLSALQDRIYSVADFPHPVIANVVRQSPFIIAMNKWNEIVDKTITGKHFQLRWNHRRGRLCH